MEYLRYTYFYVRLLKSPQTYGMLQKIHNLEFKNVKFISEDFIRKLIEENLLKLSDLKMIRYDKNSGVVNSTDLGRSASHFYINCETMKDFCEKLKLNTDQSIPEIDIDEEILITMAKSKEF